MSLGSFPMLPFLWHILFYFVLQTMWMQSRVTYFRSLSLLFHICVGRKKLSKRNWWQTNSFLLKQQLGIANIFSKLCSNIKRLRSKNGFQNVEPKARLIYLCQILKKKIKSFLYENLKTPVYRTRLVMTNYWSLACNASKSVKTGKLWSNHK